LRRSPTTPRRRRSLRRASRFSKRYPGPHSPCR
jgi:hypothetical protein